MKQQVGLTQGGSPLEVMAINNDRQPLASGNDLFTVSGRIINPTATSQPVPPITGRIARREQAEGPPQLDDLAADRHAVAKRERVFHSAEVDVPEGGKFIRVRLGDVGLSLIRIR